MSIEVEPRPGDQIGITRNPFEEVVVYDGRDNTSNGGVLTPYMEWIQANETGLLKEASETWSVVAGDLRQLFQFPGDALLRSYIELESAPQRIQETLTALGKQLPKDMLGKLIPPGQLDAVLETLSEMPEAYTIPYVLWRVVAPWRRPLPCQGQRGLPDGGVCSALTFLKEFNQALKNQKEKPDYLDALRTAAGKAISPDCPHHWDKRALAVIKAWQRLAGSPVVGKLLTNLPAEFASAGVLLSLAAQGQSCGETWKQMQPTREWTGPPTSTRATSYGLGSGDCSISPGVVVALLGLSALMGLALGCNQSHRGRSR